MKKHANGVPVGWNPLAAPTAGVNGQTGRSAAHKPGHNPQQDVGQPEGRRNRRVSDLQSFLPRIRTVSIAMQAFLIFTNVSAIGLLPVGIPEYDFVYDRLERQELLTSDKFDYQLGPYRLDRQQFDTGPFEQLANLTTGELQLFGFAAEDFRSAKRSLSNGFESFLGGLAAQPTERLFVYDSFKLDEKLAEDASYTGKKWRGLAGDVHQAFAAYNTESFHIMLGRYASFWGPRNSLALAPTVPLDGFGYSYRWGRLALSYRLARLDGLNPDRDSVAQFENRFFAGHRLDIHFADWLRVGLFETVIFGGPGRQVELFYLNPLIFFHGSQLNQSTDDNTMVGFDVSAKPRKGMRLYMQVLVDDIQVDNHEQADQEPDQIGMIAGVETADLLFGLDTKLEYSRVANWMFNQAQDRNRYLHNGQLLGASLGNDYEIWSLSARKWLSPDRAIGLLISRLNQGEGRVTADWTMPWLDVVGPYSEPFPTGIVEKRTRLEFSATGFLVDHLFAQIETGVDWFSNQNHLSGQSDGLPYFRLKISTFFDLPVRID